MPEGSRASRCRASLARIEASAEGEQKDEMRTARLRGLMEEFLPGDLTDWGEWRSSLSMALRAFGEPRHRRQSKCTNLAAFESGFGLLYQGGGGGGVGGGGVGGVGGCGRSGRERSGEGGGVVGLHLG